jgi:hypothetical protein
MPPAIQTTCPGCKKSLRVPARYIDQPVRCRHCGQIIRVKSSLKEFQNLTSREPGTSAASACATPSEDEALLPLGADPLVRTRDYLRRSRRRKWIILIVICIAGGAAAAGYTYRTRVGKWAEEMRASAEDRDPPKLNNALRQVPPASPGFPRRALAICVNNYLYANPVSYGEPGHDLHSLMEQLSSALHIPPPQMIELSDAASPKEVPKVTKTSKSKNQQNRLVPPAAHPPLKSVIEPTIRNLVDTSRAQDSMLLIYCGHVTVIDKELYLVPLEGELTDKKTLVPITWLLDRLMRCAARQKVLILDTCRIDPTAGPIRPGTDPLPSEFDDLFSNPPDGVQIWSSCGKGQHSYELDGTSIFLETLQQALADPARTKDQRPEDPLPLASLAEAVNRSTSSEVAKRWKVDQTPRFVGREMQGGHAFDPNEPEPPRVGIASAKVTAGKSADEREIREILSEINLPPIQISEEHMPPLRLDMLMPFSAAIMDAYKPDGVSPGEVEKAPDKFPLRAAVIKAVKQLNDLFNPKRTAAMFRRTIAGGGNEKIKEVILKEQMKLAKLLLDLQEMLEELRKAGIQRDRESSQRWQAHFDYVLAHLLARNLYLNEYDLMLGKIRKDELPELAPNSGITYRLLPQEKLQSGKEVRELETESKKILAKLVMEHAGTPWEVLAKRAQVTALGLKWEPVR